MSINVLVVEVRVPALAPNFLHDSLLLNFWSETHKGVSKSRDPIANGIASEKLRPEI